MEVEHSVYKIKKGKYTQNIVTLPKIWARGVERVKIEIYPERLVITPVRMEAEP